MRKKFLKNQPILNRNIYINFYSNYLIYNYLNNYNLKFFFYFLSKKRYYLKNKKKITYLNSLNIRNKCIVLNKQFKFSNTRINKITTKDKFFQSVKASSINYSFINNQLPTLKNTTQNVNTNAYISNKSLNYIVLSNNLNNQLCKLTLIYKEVMCILFILNLIKIFEIYKTIINLIYLNIKI
jgi:hypothetical protein